ncbi:MAG: helix-turn-helix domain-containing protein [Clostridia bacterium]|nr:helix-turn-helix domain-containing protein [Clostridia bacterium]
MQFIEFEEVLTTEQMTMSAPHSHEFYELYFLLDGKRNFFTKNKMFVVEENTLIVVPPYSFHKTEGGAYRRINVNVSPSLLTPTQNEFLMKISDKTAIKMSKDFSETIKTLLMQGVQAQKRSTPDKGDNLLAITKTVLLLLSTQDTVSLAAASTAYKPNDVPAEFLKVLYYINNNLTKQISLKSLCDEFYLSKVTLCKKFKEVMHCSIMDYVNGLRLNKAKSMLRETNKSMEDIAEECGYSSANYFGLVFKRDMGISPLNYRKTR